MMSAGDNLRLQRRHPVSSPFLTKTRNSRVPVQSNDKKVAFVEIEEITNDQNAAKQPAPFRCANNDPNVMAVYVAVVKEVCNFPLIS